MKRRHFLISMLAAVAPAKAADKPWHARFLASSFDGKFYQSGLLVQMQPGWKTYWRVPGAGGVPPSVGAAGINLKTFRLDCPLPQRIPSPEGENIGYHDEVCFPIVIEPQDASLPVNLHLNAFFGVCETICIPAQLDDALTANPVVAAGADDLLMQRWRMQVPQEADLVVAAKADRAKLVLHLKKPVLDIFVECPDLPQIYAQAPHRENDRLMIAVSGLKPDESLGGKLCRITFATEDGPLEQTLTVS